MKLIVNQKQKIKTKTLTLSPPIPLRLYTLPYCYPPVLILIFDIRALWHSRMSGRVPECQKSKLVCETSMALNTSKSNNLERWH